MMGADTPPPPPGAPPGVLPPDGLRTGRLDPFRFAVFAAALGVWTWKLLEPSPVPEALTAELGADWRFALAKALHAMAYAFLTVLVFALPVARRWHWFLVGALAAHGAATEFGQTFVPNRSGTVRDVLIDWCGIALGVLACYWARRLMSGPVPPTSHAPSEPQSER